MSLRVVIAEDNALLREGMRGLISRGRRPRRWSRPAPDLDELFDRPGRPTHRTSCSPTSGCPRRAPTRACRRRDTAARTIPGTGWCCSASTSTRATSEGAAGRRGGGSRLPAEGAGGRRGRARRAPCGRWPPAARSSTRKVVEALVQSGSPPRRRRPRPAQRPRTRGAGRDGPRAQQRPDRRDAVHHPAGRGEAHQLDLRQARRRRRRTRRTPASGPCCCTCPGAWRERPGAGPGAASYGAAGRRPAAVPDRAPSSPAGDRRHATSSSARRRTARRRSSSPSGCAPSSS